MSTPLFTWVHISDLHLGHGSESDRLDQQLVLGRLKEDIAHLKNRLSRKLDCLLITGDIAFTAQKEQFQDAMAWIRELTDSVNIDLRSGLTVPGNHDVLRSDWGTTEYLLWNNLRGSSSGQARRLDDALKKIEYRELLAKRIQSYRRFVGSLSPAMSESEFDDTQLFWTQRLPPKEGVELVFVGLNTALLCNGANEKGLLQLGKRGLVAARSLKKATNQVVVVLTHHPLDWLQDGKDIGSWINADADIHLHGHIHEQDVRRVIQGAGTKLITVVSGAAHEPKPTHARYGYNFGQIIRDDSGELTLRIWPRIFEDPISKFRTDGANLADGQDHADFPLNAHIIAPEAPALSKVAQAREEFVIRAIHDPEQFREFELVDGSDLYSSFHPLTGELMRLHVWTTDGVLHHKEVSSDGTVTIRESQRKNWIDLVKDPLRPFEIQIGLTRAARPGGDPGSLPFVQELTLSTLEEMYPVMIGGRHEYLRMVFAELATDPDVLNYIYKHDPKQKIRDLAARNPSAAERIRTEACPFCDQGFMNARRIYKFKDAQLMRNDFPYGPFFHYIVMPQEPIHSWEDVKEQHLLEMNQLILEFFRSEEGKKKLRHSAGIHIGFNSSLRHLVMSKTTRSSAGASIAHVHKQIWGMSPCSTNLGDHLDSLCALAKSRLKTDYLGRYIDAMRQLKYTVWEDENVALYVPFGQISLHELQAVVLKPNRGSFLDLDPTEVASLSKAEYIVTQLFQRMNIHSFNEIMLSKPFKRVCKDDTFRLVVTFITREIDLAVSELSLLYVVDGYPESTLALIDDVCADIPEVKKYRQSIGALP